jgi:hypothetical protein
MIVVTAASEIPVLPCFFSFSTPGPLACALLPFLFFFSLSLGMPFSYFTIQNHGRFRNKAIASYGQIVNAA